MIDKIVDLLHKAISDLGVDVELTGSSHNDHLDETDSSGGGFKVGLQIGGDGRPPVDTVVDKKVAEVITEKPGLLENYGKDKDTDRTGFDKQENGDNSNRGGDNDNQSGQDYNDQQNRQLHENDRDDNDGQQEDRRGNKDNERRDDQSGQDYNDEQRRAWNEGNRNEGENGRDRYGTVRAPARRGGTMRDKLVARNTMSRKDFERDQGISKGSKTDSSDCGSGGKGRPVQRGVNLALDSSEEDWASREARPDTGHASQEDYERDFENSRRGDGCSPSSRESNDGRYNSPVLDNRKSGDKRNNSGRRGGGGGRERRGNDRSNRDRNGNQNSDNRRNRERDGRGNGSRRKGMSSKYRDDSSQLTSRLVDYSY